MDDTWQLKNLWPCGLLKVSSTDLRHLNKNLTVLVSRRAKRWVPGEKPLRAENSLQGRLSEGKVKGIRTSSKCVRGEGTSPPFSLAREFPSPFLSNPCLSGWVGERTQNKLSPHIASPTRTRTRWQASAPTTVPRWLLPLSKLTNRKFRSCSFLRVSLSLAISSTFLWRNPNKKTNIFVLAVARLKLFKTTRNKSFCLFADLFFSLERAYGNGNRGGFSNR